MKGILHYLTLAILTLHPIKGFAGCSYFFTTGPELYYFIRDREGGTHQKGPINGFRVTLERFKGWSWYAGIDYLYAKGILKGETAMGRTLKSELIDQIFEARVGFTLQQKRNRLSFITPFVGGGFFKEQNDFFSPSPLPCKFTDSFNYLVAGFLSGINFTPLLSMGINFKLRFMQKAESEVTNDPLFEDVTLRMKEEMHVRVDLPFKYAFDGRFRGFGVQIAPFYEYRHFGGREGFPFNFRDTKFYLYGAQIALTYRF